MQTKAYVQEPSYIEYLWRPPTTIKVILQSRMYFIDTHDLSMTDCIAKIQASHGKCYLLGWFRYRPEKLCYQCNPFYMYLELNFL